MKNTHDVRILSFLKYFSWVNISPSTEAKHLKLRHCPTHPEPTSENTIMWCGFTISKTSTVYTHIASGCPTCYIVLSTYSIDSYRLLNTNIVMLSAEFCANNRLLDKLRNDKTFYLIRRVIYEVSFPAFQNQSKHFISPFFKDPKRISFPNSTSYCSSTISPNVVDSLVKFPHYNFDESILTRQTKYIDRLSWHWSSKSWPFCTFTSSPPSLLDHTPYFAAVVTVNLALTLFCFATYTDHCNSHICWSNMTAGLFWKAVGAVLPQSTQTALLKLDFHALRDTFNILIRAFSVAKRWLVLERRK